MFLFIQILRSLFSANEHMRERDEKCSELYFNSIA